MADKESPRPEANTMAETLNTAITKLRSLLVSATVRRGLTLTFLISTQTLLPLFLLTRTANLTASIVIFLPTGSGG